MNMVKEIKNTPRILLDCTLRDGGYVNNWEFSRETVFRVMDELYDAGIRYIEIGIMGKNSGGGGGTKFSSFEQMIPLLAHRKKDCNYAVMLNQAEASCYDIPLRSEKTVDLIRIAFFKQESLAALKKAQELTEKGYQVFLQAMATFLYTDDELAELLEQVNIVRPTAFYIVDSFSTMYRQDVQKMSEFVAQRLSEDVQFGFHAHNNIQMAYSNVITFFETLPNRSLIADGSIYGMGRGAGNVPTELLMEYLNKTCQTAYGITRVLKLFQDQIKPIFEKYFWGFSPTYYLTASKNMNSVYGWYFSNRGISDVQEMNELLEQIPTDIRYTLSQEAADTAIKTLHEGRRE